MQIRIPNPIDDSVDSWTNYIRAIWKDPDNMKRKQESKQVIDYYDDKQYSYLDDELSKLYTDPYSKLRKAQWTMNYTKGITDGIAQCYSAKVRRNITVSGKKKLSFLEEKIFAGLNTLMKDVNRWTFLEKTALVFCKWSAQKNHIVYKTYHQFQFDLVFEPDAAEKTLNAVILSDYTNFESSNIYVYTANKFYHFIGDKIQSYQEHNLGVLPFVVIYTQDPAFDDYLEPRVELSRQNLELNVLHSYALNLSQKHVHGVPFIVLPHEEALAGIDDTDPNMSHPSDRFEHDRRLDLQDPDKGVVTNMNEQGHKPSLEYVQQKCDFPGLLDVIRFKTNMLANNYGLENGVNDVQVSTNPATLFWITEKRRQAIIGDYQSIFIDAEKELFRKAYQIAKKASVDIPDVDPDTFTIEFSPEKAMIDKMTSTEVLAAWTGGLIDTVEAIRQHYPTLSRTEAIDFIKEMSKDEKDIGAFLLKKAQQEQPVTADTAPDTTVEEPVNKGD